MISEKNIEKVKKFYGAVLKLQTVRGRELGLLVVKKETLGDLAALCENSNRALIIDVSKGCVEDIINDLANGIKNGSFILIKIGEYLDQEIYNQLFLLAHANHMEFPRLEKRIFIDSAKETVIVLVSTDKELEKLNYQNIFDIVGLTERL
jgi:hypothetical protein